MEVTKSTDWDCGGDPVQDLINLKEMIEQEEENWERDFWVSDKEKDFLSNTERGKRIMHILEMTTGYKLNLRTPREIGVVVVETDMIMNEESLFKPLPTYKKLVGDF